MTTNLVGKMLEIGYFEGAGYYKQIGPCVMVFIRGDLVTIVIEGTRGKLMTCTLQGVDSVRIVSKCPACDGYGHDSDFVSRFDPVAVSHYRCHDVCPSKAETHNQGPYR